MKQMNMNVYGRVSLFRDMCLCSLLTVLTCWYLAGKVYHVHHLSSAYYNTTGSNNPSSCYSQEPLLRPTTSLPVSQHRKGATDTGSRGSFIRQTSCSPGLTQSTTEADENFISFAGISSRSKLSANFQFWCDDGARQRLSKSSSRDD